MSETNMTNLEDVAKAAAEDKVAEQAILKESLDQARAQAADYYDQLVRLKAEFENFRKRGEKEKADARRWGKEDIIVQLISLMDVMEQAETAAHKTTDTKSIVAGLDMLYAAFKRLLKDEGLEQISPENQAFDPKQHEAVETVEGDGEENRVLDVLQKGYTFQGALVRPARVKVSKKKPG